MFYIKLFTVNLLLVLTQQAIAADDIQPPPSLDQSTNTTLQKAQTPPPALPEDDSRNIPQPEVRIIRKKDTVIEEYRVNGQLRYVKITPSSGPAYYLADTDGDGVLETRENDLDNPPINRWILLEW